MKPTAEDEKAAQALAREILDSVGGGKWKTECYDRAAYRIASMRASEREKVWKDAIEVVRQIGDRIQPGEEYNEFHGLIVEVIAALEVAAIRAGDKE